VFHNTTPDLQDQNRFDWSQTGLVLRLTVSDHIIDCFTAVLFRQPWELLEGIL